jgi:hypothetical protein
MKLIGTVLFTALASTAFVAHPSARSEPMTLVVASVDTSRMDAFIGNLRYSGADLVYAAGRRSAPAAQRVGTALGTRVVVDSTLGVDGEEAATALANRVRSAGARVVVVLIDADAAQPFLRRVTEQPRSSFALSGAPGRMWLVSLGSGYTSAIRGSF